MNYQKSLSIRKPAQRRNLSTNFSWEFRHYKFSKTNHTTCWPRPAGPASADEWWNSHVGDQWHEFCWVDAGPLEGAHPRCQEDPWQDYHRKFRSSQLLDAICCKYCQMLVRKHLLWYQKSCAHGPPVDAEKFSETELSNGPFFECSVGISKKMLKQERLFLQDNWPMWKLNSTVI